MKKVIYFDNNATTQILPEVKERIIELLNSSYGNPSSAHSYSNLGRSILSSARDTMSRFLNCFPEQVYFTASGSEANNQILHSVRYWKVPKGIIVSKAEHSSILKTVLFLSWQGLEVAYVDVNEDGIVDLQHLEELLSTNRFSLVSIAMANGETGVYQPMSEIVSLSHTYSAYVHSDASQYAGKAAINFEDLNIDFLTISAHKLHAPPGSAALIARDSQKLVPLIWGGNQEYEKRAGTENILSIAAFAKAVEIRHKELNTSIKKLENIRNSFEHQLFSTLKSISINGSSKYRVANVSNICFKGIDGQALMFQLDNYGIICSQTSACTSQIPEPSHVLTAMGLSEEDAYSSLRFSFGIKNNTKEVDYSVKIIKKVVTSMKQDIRIRKA